MIDEWIEHSEMGDETSIPLAESIDLKEKRRKEMVIIGDGIDWGNACPPVPIPVHPSHPLLCAFDDVPSFSYHLLPPPMPERGVQVQEEGVGDGDQERVHSPDPLPHRVHRCPLLSSDDFPASRRLESRVM